MNAETAQNELFATTPFEPTRAAALARVAAVRPAAYARTRNHLDGDVTRLSPYLTHGLVSLREVLAGVLRNGALPVQHKLVFELAWREYFRHVWLHAGDGIFESLHEGVRPDAAYGRAVPDDVLQGCSGVPVIDQAVRTLYATGYLHNHARMWLASYLVHLRKVHWRTGADWMVAHLLDGDLASNHLSWQWVAGTGSRKPYLFNAENVARYSSPEWHSAGSVIDTDYATLDARARSPQAVAAGRAAARIQAVQPPELSTTCPADVAQVVAPAIESVRGRDVLLLHPWSLHSTAPDSRTPGVLRIGLLLEEFHQRRPWSRARWQFAGTALQAQSDVIWRCDAATLVQTLAAARSIQGRHDPHLQAWLQGLPLAAPERLLRWPSHGCDSFFKFWTLATKGLRQASELLDPH